MRQTRESSVTYYDWHVSRWLASDTRALLDPAGRGIYREALDLCYVTGSIPKDPQLLARKLDCTEEQLRRVWPVISRHFRTDKKHPSTLTNRFADTFRTNFFRYLYQQKQNGMRVKRKAVPLKTTEINKMSSGGVNQTNERTNELIELKETNERTNDNRSPSPLPETDWPMTAAAVCEAYPATDSAMLVAIIHSGVQAAVAADVAERLTDEVLAEAVRCAKRSAPKQNSSALFRKTVPAVIRNWARDAKAAKRA
jgi:hypothetical protein